MENVTHYWRFIFLHIFYMSTEIVDRPIRCSYKTWLWRPVKVPAKAEDNQPTKVLIYFCELERSHSSLSYISNERSYIIPDKPLMFWDECGRSPFKRYGSASWAHMSFIWAVRCKQRTAHINHMSPTRCHILLYEGFVTWVRTWYMPLTKVQDL